MISDFPAIKIPESITAICDLKLNNSKVIFGEIADIIEQDSFLNMFVKKTFSKYLNNGGVLRMLATLGWDGFRNRIAEAYIYYYRFGRYPDSIELDEVYDLLDIEKRFDFLYSEGESAVFKFGFYLKICDIYFEKNDSLESSEFITIPIEVDEILTIGRSKSSEADWLVLIIWSLVELLGINNSKQLISNTGGDWSLILSSLSEDQQYEVYSSLLKYGNGVNNLKFFTQTRV